MMTLSWTPRHLQFAACNGLRVADASIMPVMPHANTNAPAIMVGERAAALVLASRTDRTAAAASPERV